MGPSNVGSQAAARTPDPQQPHLLGGDEQHFVAGLLDALFGARDPDLVTRVIWAWDLDFGCSF